MKKTILTLIAIILATLVARAGFYAAPQINLNPQSPIANLHEASAPVAASPVVNEPSAVAPSPYNGSNFTGTSLRGAENVYEPEEPVLRKGKSLLTLSAGYSSFGSRDILQHNTLTFGIAVSSCERWFFKRKFN